MKRVSAVVLALSISAPCLAWATDPPVPPPAAAPAAPTAAVPAAPTDATAVSPPAAAPVAPPVAAPPAAAPVAPPPAMAPMAPLPPPNTMAQSDGSVPPDQELPSDSKPSSGIGFLVTGGIFTGIGALNLLTAPLCTTDFLIPNRSAQQGCLIASLAIGGTFAAIGVPLLIVGGVKRSAYKKWKADNPMVGGLGFSTVAGGGMLTFGGEL
jgi:hypothetical protein